MNQLVEVKQGTTTIATFEYDGFGRRTEKAAGGVTRTYIYDAEDIVEERLSGSTTDTIRYYHGAGIDEPLARKNSSDVVTYYLADHLGSIVQESSGAGAITLEREYDPWGVLSQGTSTSGYAFTGREWDAEIALYQYRARYYSPASGRFLGEDPVRSFHTQFAYVSNSPLRYTDPTGQFIWALPLLASPELAAVVATGATLVGLAIWEGISNRYFAKDTEEDIDDYNEKAFEKDLTKPERKPTDYPDADDDGENLRKTQELIRRKSGRDPIETIDKSTPKPPARSVTPRSPMSPKTPGGKKSCP